MRNKIDFKKYLPETIRDTRWGEWMEAYQDLIFDIKDETIDKPLTQFDKTVADTDDFKNILTRFGYPYIFFDGYSNTTEYFKRQAETVVERVLYKTTKRGYDNTFYIYQMYGDVLPLYKKPSENFYTPYYDWESFDENPQVISTLDTGGQRVQFYSYYRLDSTFEVDSPGRTMDSKYIVSANPKYSENVAGFLDNAGLIESLDQTSILDFLTRKLLVRFSPNIVEDEDTFYTEHTMRAFYNDIYFQRRATEILYFQPSINIHFYENGDNYTYQYPCYTGSCFDSQLSKLITGNPLSTATVKIGNSQHAVIDGTITNVANEIYSLSISDFIINTENYFTIELKITDTSEIDNCSEIALLDGSNNCILYSTFPKVYYYDKMNKSIRFVFKKY